LYKLKANTGWIILFLLLLTASGSCKKSPADLIPPDILISNSLVLVDEDNPSGMVTLTVEISSESEKPVTLDYNTADGTALAGKDYIPVAQGKITFAPGEISKNILIDILPDTSVKEDVFFTVQLKQPVNAVLGDSAITVQILNTDYATLVWSDEFNGVSLNNTVWNFEQGATGWGNNELQNYTNSTDNVHLDSGYLHITALNPSGSTYTSGRITTQGKKEFTYLRVEIRAKLPEGQGLWPALWMLGANFSTVGWPRCGETDIMELLGNYPSTVHAAIHWDSNGHASRTGEFSLQTGKFSSGFHIFSLIWTPNKLKWLVDGQSYFYLSRSAISGFPFDLPQFFIFNVAVGGNWPGPPDQTTIFPQNMIIDYIRVYQ
jgi:beta-glucanase (GH16 family)